MHGAMHGARVDLERGRRSRLGQLVERRRPELQQLRRPDGDLLSERLCPVAHLPTLHWRHMMRTTVHDSRGGRGRCHGRRPSRPSTDVRPTTAARRRHCAGLWHARDGACFGSTWLGRAPCWAFEGRALLLEGHLLSPGHLYRLRLLCHVRWCHQPAALVPVQLLYRPRRSCRGLHIVFTPRRSGLRR